VAVAGASQLANGGSSMRRDMVQGEGSEVCCAGLPLQASSMRTAGQGTCVRLRVGQAGEFGSDGGRHASCWDCGVCCMGKPACCGGASGLGRIQQHS
jgi:hypothetical protein